MGVNVVLHRAKSTFLEHIICRGVYPIPKQTIARFVFPSHSEGGADMKPFQPSLAPVKEHRLHHCLVELGSDAWCYILPSQHLTDACPYPPSLPDLLPHGLDIVVVLGAEASEVLEQPSVPEEMHQQGITLAGSWRDG